MLGNPIIAKNPLSGLYRDDIAAICDRLFDDGYVAWCGLSGDTGLTMSEHLYIVSKQGTVMSTPILPGLRWDGPMTHHKWAPTDIARRGRDDIEGFSDATETYAAFRRAIGDPFEDDDLVGTSAIGDRNV